MIAALLAVQADGVEIVAALTIVSGAVAAVWTFLTRRLDKTEAARDAERTAIEAARAVERDKYLASVQAIATQHEAAMGRFQTTLQAEVKELRGDVRTLHHRVLSAIGSLGPDTASLSRAPLSEGALSEQGSE